MEVISACACLAIIALALACLIVWLISCIRELQAKNVELQDAFARHRWNQKMLEKLENGDYDRKERDA